jgi:hypothetical protein
LTAHKENHHVIKAPVRPGDPIRLDRDPLRLRDLDRRLNRKQKTR